MDKTSKYAAILLCVLLVVAPTVSTVYTGLYADHECIGRHCEICYEMAYIKNMLKQLYSAFFIPSIPTAFIFIQFLLLWIKSVYPGNTLISLKVQLNN